MNSCIRLFPVSYNKIKSTGQSFEAIISDYLDLYRFMHLMCIILAVRIAFGRRLKENFAPHSGEKILDHILK